jgi:anti-sigma-K factor RskA
MNADPEIRFGCSEEFAELCALSTTGSLTADERSLLERHISSCEKCSALLADYKSLASDGMAKLAVELNLDEDIKGIDHEWAQAEARKRILDQLSADDSSQTKATPQATVRFGSLRRGARIPSGPYVVRLLKIAAIVLLGVLLGYQFGFRRGTNHARTDSPAVALSLQQELTDLRGQRVALNITLTSKAKIIDDLNERSQREQKELAGLEDVKASLEKTTSQLSSTNEQQASSLESVSAQRDELDRKWQDAEQSLQNVRTDLNKVQDERQKLLLQTASLETRIGELSATLRETNESSDRQKDFLASDRDIRELMGARQLYIADVFDVDHNGKKRKPFGRVFYTKGKSLIFYAFDLDQQPGSRDAKAFQVWGSPYEDQSSPVSLGIFYMDSEANRRWVLKSDNPTTLAQINAVFVTVEPNGESKTPSGKPFLYAYLRSAAANHP